MCGWGGDVLIFGYEYLDLPETSEVQRDNKGMDYWRREDCEIPTMEGQLCADAYECEMGMGCFGIQLGSFAMAEEAKWDS